jgi:hypothetical protein
VRYGAFGNNVVGYQETYRSDRSYCDVLPQGMCWFISRRAFIQIEERGHLRARASPFSIGECKSKADAAVYKYVRPYRFHLVMQVSSGT